MAEWNRRSDRWRDAKSDQPDDYGMFIVYSDTEGVTPALYNPDINDGRCKWYSVDMYESYDIYDVTHWMPLPKPPKEVQDGN